MNTLFFLIGIAAIVAVNSFLAYTLGWLFTEVIILPLNFKPFNCRPCLTFWFTSAIGTAFAELIAPHFPGAADPAVYTTVAFGLTGVGLLAGLINFLYIKLKFRIYD